MSAYHLTSAALSGRLRTRLRTLVEGVGLLEAARLVGVSHAALARAAAGFHIRELTRRAIAEGLAALDAEGVAA